MRKPRKKRCNICNRMIQPGRAMAKHKASHKAKGETSKNKMELFKVK